MSDRYRTGERHNAEGSLHRSEEHFRLLVEGVKDYAIFMLDFEGRVATWNEGAERIKGHETGEIIGGRFYTRKNIERGHRPRRRARVRHRESCYADFGGKHGQPGGRMEASS